MHHDSGYPRAWRFDQDGDIDNGEFVRISAATTEYGERPIITLKVGHEERALWLSTHVLQRKFAEELERRNARNFDPGERISVSRGKDKKVSGTGRPYWPFSVTFVDAPQADAAALLNAPVDGDEAPPF